MTDSELGEGRSGDPRYVDGILYNRYGDPIRFDFLVDHPDDPSRNSGEKVEVPAKWVFHLYRQERAEQHRGISEIAPALTVANQLRSYRKSVVKAAKNAACLWGFLSTNLPAVIDEEMEGGDSCCYEDRCQPGDTMPISPDELICTPDGYSVSMTDPKQPTQNHEAFMKTQIMEMGRADCVPLNKAMGSSADYNYSSGRLDYQDYWKCISIDRFDIEVKVCLLYTSPSPRDATLSRMPSSA